MRSSGARIGYRGAAVIVSMFACAAVVAACGSGGGQSTLSGATHGAAGAAEDPVPDGLIVYRPAMVDTQLTPADLPDWPGPDPAELLEPDPDGPAPESGTITAPDTVRRVLGAAADNDAVMEPGQRPDEVDGGLWATGQGVQWLVVAPAERINPAG